MKQGGVEQTQLARSEKKACRDEKGQKMGKWKKVQTSLTLFNTNPVSI